MNKRNEHHSNSGQSTTGRGRTIASASGAALCAFVLASIAAPSGTAAAAPSIDDLLGDVVLDDIAIIPTPSMPVPGDDPFVPVFTIPTLPDFPLPDIDDLGPTAPIPTVPDGPVFTIPEIEDFPPVELPDDFMLPTPVECNDWNPDLFSASVGVLDASDIEIAFAYDDDDVCSYSVGWNLRDANDVSDIRASGMIGLPDIAASTTDAGDDYRFGIGNDGLCDWEVWVGVEESLPIVFTGTSDDCDTPAGTDPDPEDAPPAEEPSPEDGDAGDEPVGDDPVDGEPSGESDDPEDGEPAGDSDEEHGDTVVPTPDEPGTPIDDGPSSDAQTTPNAQLPQTGSNTTQLLLGGGLVVIGLGTAAALASRRRTDDALGALA